MLVHVAGNSLVIRMIENKIEHETIDTSIVTSVSQLSSLVYIVVMLFALYFSSSTESVKFFTMIHQITLCVSSFNECLELFLDFGHVFVGLSDVKLLAVSDVLSLGNPYIFLFYL